MIRRGKNLVQKILEGKRWIDAFPVGTIVSPVLMTDDHYFTGEVVEVQPKINKVFVSWDGGSQPTQHDPDELEPIYPCTASSGAAHSKKASIKKASMSDYEYTCATYIRNAIQEEHNAVAIYDEMAQIAQDANFKSVAESLSREEKVHIGELTDLLNRYSGNEIETMADGICENVENIGADGDEGLEKMCGARTGVDTMTEVVEVVPEAVVAPVTETLEPVPDDVVVVGIEPEQRAIDIGQPPTIIPLLTVTASEKKTSLTKTAL